jgi:predicted ATP-grasp superfamily ATP-dependent carboligase
MSKVLVTDGRAPATLAIARSLGQRGIEVHCGECFKYNLSSFSKYVTDQVRYPSPDDEPEAFVDRLTEVVRTGDYEMVFPVRDETTLLIADHQDRLSEWTRLYLASREAITTLNDKGETVKLARQAGVPVPTTYFPEEMSIDRIKRQAEYPVLIRPRESSGSRGILPVESAAGFDDAYTQVEAEYGTPMIQEYVDKTGYSTACVMLDERQREVASFSYERLKEYPLSGGPTVVGVSTDDEEVKSHARTLLQEVSWKGAAEVEFILDETGSPRLLEVNPRFWTPLQLAISSGVDFPYLIWQSAHGCDEYVDEYECGVTYRWMLPNEILWTLNAPDKKRGIKDLLNGRGNHVCYSVLSSSDPLPTLGTFAQSLDFLWDPRKRRMIFDRGW